MKATIEIMVQIPDDFVVTGEFRVPRRGDMYIYRDNDVNLANINHGSVPRLIVRYKEKPCQQQEQ